MIVIKKITVPKKKLSFWLALLLAIAAGGSVYFAIDRLFMPVQVVVAAKTIEAKTVISDKDVKLVNVSKIDKYPTALTDLKQAVGKYTEVCLYEGEQIIAERLTSSPGTVTGAFRFLDKDETYLTFTSSEAKWPKGLKAGDTLTAVAFINNVEEKLGERLKVLSVGENNSESGVQQVKQQVLPQNTQEKITIGLKWNQAGKVLEGLARAKQVVFLPEHPEKEIGGELYATVQPEQQPELQGTGQKGKESGKR